MKKCPFCKNEIELNSTECTFCKMLLIEKVPSTPTQSSYSYIPPKEPKQKGYTSYYAEPPKSSVPKKEFKLPKNSGWIISIVGSILLSVVLNHRSTPNPLPAPIPTTMSDNIPSKTSYRYLPNGTVLFKSVFSFNGEGVLNISNGNDSDVVIKLITSIGRKVYSVYISANNSYSIKNIDDGDYRVLFSSGADWDSDQNKFLVNPSAKAFNDNFNFQTTDTTSVWEITLKPVIGGNATSNQINLSEFDKY